MPALYAVLGLFALLTVARLGRRSFTNRRSIDDYHRAMGVLGEITEHRHVHPAAGTAETSAAASDTERTSNEAIRHHEEKPLVFLADGATEADTASSFPATSSNRETPRARVVARRGYPIAILLVLAVVGAGLGLALRVGGQSGARSDAASQHSRPTPNHTGPKRHRRIRTRPVVANSTSTTTTLGLSNTRPMIEVVTPETPAPGQTVTLRGANFTSASGEIVAVIGDEPVPTHCPSEQQCLATVLPNFKGTVNVTIRTDSGVSNAVTIHIRSSRT